ncbi:DUF3306 domain-containing protein [Pikeienuella piscinae]|uniref:DUF3306 domain-containing protein n=1 Tax=Pikeienuella piscinae TaxID=2748098 RepID=A0A7L5BYL4_9RHOB|nr:DUF3306 domain-containing protein [Pikeienuella piscinae]QIE55607.1 DUF3306 domain-containing protein [Pikeienuella piscinae]
MSAGEDDFLSRWSRRKRDAEAGVAPDDEPPAPPNGAQEGSPEGTDQRSDEEILEALGLKHPDALEPGDDVRGFMQAAAPERLRRMALRRLWRLNPVLANLDGLVDHGDDFTDAATVRADMKTLYRVGAGMLRELTEPVEPESEDAVEPDPATLEEPMADTEPLSAPDTPADIQKAARAESGVDEVAGPTRKRMAFRREK